MENILITGATGEIGRALSEFFSKKNVQLLLVGRNFEKLNALKDKLCNQPAEIFIEKIDYNDPQSYGNLKNIIQEKLDGLVLIPPKISQTTQCLPSKDEWIDRFTNVFVNPLEFFKSAIPFLLKAKPSKVIIISGISSKILLSNYAINGAIRAAWHAQVKAMAFEYGNSGLHINTLSLGGVMTSSFIEKTREEAIRKNITFEKLMLEKTSNVPLNKYASLNDIGNAVDGLLGSFSDHMTGSNLFCDGGFLKVY